MVRSGPPISGLPEIGIINAQVGYSDLRGPRLEPWPRGPVRLIARGPSFETRATRAPQDEGGARADVRWARFVCPPYNAAFPMSEARIE